MKRMIAVFLLVVVPIFAGPVDANTASVADLEKVSGLGPTLAARIVEYRKANGPFATLDDLSKISGIGPKKLEALRDSLTVSSKKLEPTEKMDLNTATAEQLQTLEGIGEKLAADIVSYRKANGLFRTLSDVTAVKGVSQGMVDKWQEQVVLKNVPPAPPKKLKLYKPPR